LNTDDLLANRIQLPRVVHFQATDVSDNMLLLICGDDKAMRMAFTLRCSDAGNLLSSVEVIGVAFINLRSVLTSLSSGSDLIAVVVSNSNSTDFLSDSAGCEGLHVAFDVRSHHLLDSVRSDLDFTDLVSRDNLSHGQGGG
jgi:hypothetical protein